ncbi:MAG: WG repeat-containing protein [Chitinophagaceae bacterium]|jgi:hypothetical protein|nr:WG repeat-containing protein [Chitinophagaceae bacterium]
MKPVFFLFLCLLALLHTKAQSLTPFRDSVTHKYGFKNEYGKITVQPVYDMVYNFSENRAAVNKGATVRMQNAGGGIWGFIDPSGNEVIPLQYSSVTSFGNHQSVVIKDRKVFSIDTSGNMIDRTQIIYRNRTDTLHETK